MSDKEKEERNQLLKDVNNVFDIQDNTVSNFQFKVTNYGLYAQDVAKNIGGGYWPRGSQNQYLFGAGVWFGAVKLRPDTNVYKKYCVVTYNPNSGRSWVVPGRIDDGPKIQGDIFKYRVYLSTEFKKTDGTPTLAHDKYGNTIKYNWPIWDTEDKRVLKDDRYFGRFVYATDDRNTTIYPKGPAYISSEDIFTTYKDTDLKYYEGGSGIRAKEGYPLQLQFEQNIYSWGFGKYKDFIFVKYDIINYSDSTYKNCWVAPILDADIALQQNASAGAEDDKARFYYEDPSLNLAVQWTMTTYGEGGHGFGYLGADFLESPSVYRIDGFVNDTTAYMNTENGPLPFNPKYEGYIRKDGKFYPNEEQIGLQTVRAWPINQDIATDDRRYDYIASKIKDQTTNAGDYRFLMATGPFNLRPRDTARVVVGLIFSSTTVSREATGTTADMKNLVDLDKFAQYVYDNNFKAPAPPDQCFITDWKPYNNAVMIQWDSTSELSNDRLENGLDFMGYRIYRARRNNLDTFAVDETTADLNYTSGKGPFGWKQVAEYNLPSPYRKSSFAGSSTDATVPNIDSLIIIGPQVSNINGKDTLTDDDMYTIRVLRLPVGVNTMPLDTLVNNAKVSQYIGNVMNVKNGAYLNSILYSIDTSFVAAPWNKYYIGLGNVPDKMNTWKQFVIDPYSQTLPNIPLIRDVMAGKIRFAKSTAKWNPLLWREVSVTMSDTAGLQEYNPATNIYYDFSSIKYVYTGSKYVYQLNKMIPISWDSCMNDYAHVTRALQQTYEFIQKGYINADSSTFVNFERSGYALANVIKPYMDSITCHRTFIDHGDDNGDNVIDYDANPKKTEKLINNMEYYYKVLAYDEGDWRGKTPSKLNFGQVGSSNVQLTYPRNARTGTKFSYDIISMDTAKLGGLYDFALFPVDGERAAQLFDGHELELSFHPVFSQTRLEFNTTSNRGPRIFGVYETNMILKDLTTGIELYNYPTFLEKELGNYAYRSMFSEDGASYIYADTTVLDSTNFPQIIANNFGVGQSKDSVFRSGTFTTSDFTKLSYPYSNGFKDIYKDVLGISFDYTILQKGGQYRPDTAFIQNASSQNISTVINPLDRYRVSGSKMIYNAQDSMKVLTTIWSDYYNYGEYYGANPIYTSFNNGSGEYTVTFTDGGTEDITVNIGKTPTRTKTFKVPYLNYKVESNIGFDTKNQFDKEVKVQQGGDVPFMQLPAQMSYVDPYYGNISSAAALDKSFDCYQPSPRSLMKDAYLFRGKYNAYALGYVNARNKFLDKDVQAARTMPINFDTATFKTYQLYTIPIGTQGRYYKSVIDGNDTLDFNNIIQIAGISWSFDYVGNGRMDKLTTKYWTLPSSKNYGDDFVAGDKVKLVTTGGAIGFPTEDAKIVFRVNANAPKNDKYTEKQLDQCKIVPNPFYVTHQGVKSPYDAKVYITRLPEQCTIKIYTINGDLIKTIEHNEYTSTDRANEEVEVWDLLSKNNQRVQSQTMVAIISTPNGEQSVQKFTVVVGGFHIPTEE